MTVAQVRAAIFLMVASIDIPFPRFPVALAPTPLEGMPGMGQRLGLVLSVKRDDLSGIAFGGNKLRQLEYYFGEALDLGATAVLVTGAVQSNYARATAAIAARAGMRCHVQLEDRVARMEGDAYRKSGNPLLSTIYGASISHYPNGEDEAGAHGAILARAKELREQGERPYIIPLLPQSRAIGALGYLNVASELLAQRPTLTHVVLASGSGQTQAGLVFGLRLLGSQVRVLGCCVRRDAVEQRKRVAWHCASLAEMLGVSSPVFDPDILTDDSALGEGYGLPEPRILDTLIEVARADGLLLDPVYTGKAFRGLMEARARGEVPEGADVAFIHTGGMPALFAYAPQILPHLEAARRSTTTSLPGEKP